MSYILKIGKKYHYSRRVPKAIREYDSRDIIRIALDTDSESEAMARSAAVNKEVESYWQKLVSTGRKHSNDSYARTLQFARLLGFKYLPAAKAAQEPLSELMDRLSLIEGSDYNQKYMDALGGAVKEPEVMLSDCLGHYWTLSRDLIINKSEYQIRKWKNPRIKAMDNFIGIVGDIPVNGIKRAHIIEFKNWWVDRINDENKAPGSANKDFIHLRSILKTIQENLEINISVEQLFSGISLKESKKTIRKPFSKPYLQDLLTGDRLNSLNTEARLAFYILADTGMRPSELTGLKEQDIIIGRRLEKEIEDAKKQGISTDIVPHIKIRERKGKSLKTPYSTRDIPLAGYALEAFEKMPAGLREYHMRAEALSACLNKYLRESGLFPTENHTLYSLRHSFQDRMNELAIPDRIQTQLFGHKFDRPEYGEGATLSKKMEWMERLTLKTGFFRLIISRSS